MSTILKELADHHNNIESIIKRAASTSSWKLGPQREKDCQCELLTISLYRKKCQPKLPLTHSRTLSSYSLTVARATILGDDQLEAGRHTRQHDELKHSVQPSEQTVGTAWNKEQ